jgi:hypothetical protein
MFEAAAAGCGALGVWKRNLLSTTPFLMIAHPRTRKPEQRCSAHYTLLREKQECFDDMVTDGRDPGSVPSSSTKFPDLSITTYTCIIYQQIDNVQTATLGYNK